MDRKSDVLAYQPSPKSGSSAENKQITGSAKRDSLHGTNKTVEFQSTFKPKGPFGTGKNHYSG